MIVELVGLVGAGKSSVAREIREQYPHVRQGWSLLRPAYLPAVSWSALRCVGAARWYRASGLERPWYLLKLLWHLDAQLDVLARAKPRMPGAVIFEEGPIFKLCWISVCAREAKIAGPAFDRWFRHARRKCGEVIDRVVWLDAPDEVLLERVRARPHLTGYGLKHKPEREAQRLLSLYRATYQGILASLEAEYRVEVTSYGTADQSPRAISAALRERYGL